MKTKYCHQVVSDLQKSFTNLISSSAENVLTIKTRLQQNQSNCNLERKSGKKSFIWQLHAWIKFKDAGILKNKDSQIRKSESLQIFKVRICESGFVSPNPKDLHRGFVSWICFWKIRFVDSFRANKNLKLLDSFQFVRIRIRIPHP